MRGEEKPRSDDPHAKKRLRLSGRISNKDLLDLEVQRRVSRPRYFDRLARDLRAWEVEELAKLAIVHENLDALVSLAKLNKFVVGKLLGTPEGLRVLRRHLERAPDSGKIPQLYMMLQGTATPKVRAIFRRLARKAILRASMKIAGRGLRGTLPKRSNYFPGMSEFDLPATIENYLVNRVLTYDHVVGIVRRRRRKEGVLVMDVSGSMYGETLVNAALTAAVLAYHMRDDAFGILLFNDRTFLLKGVREKRTTGWLVDRVLDSEAAGFTNIRAALERGLRELDRLTNPERFAVAITDGVYNRGGDPLPVAKRFRKLHVIGLPGADTHAAGIKTCKRLARAAGGKYVPVREFAQIPRALLRLLQGT